MLMMEHRKYLWVLGEWLAAHTLSKVYRGKAINLGTSTVPLLNHTTIANPYCTWCWVTACPGPNQEWKPSVPHYKMP